MCLQAYLRRASASDDQPCFLLYDFLPARASLSAVTAYAPRAMPMARFVSFTRRLLLTSRLGLSKYDLKRITTYSARRVLPSVADAAGCSVSERLAVGAWSDPAPDGSLQVQARRLAMPIRYSEQRINIAASIKARLVRGVASALSSYSVSGTASDDPSWDQVLKFLPAWDRSEGSGSTASEPQSQVAKPFTSSSSSARVWICSRSKVGRLHAVAQEATAPSSQRSDSNILKTVCGKILSDPLTGSGPAPSGRKWCLFCNLRFSAIPR